MPFKVSTYKVSQTICDNHKKKETRKSSYERGYNNAWRSARMHYLKHNPLCYDCKQNNIYTGATEVHHILKASEHPTLFYDDELWMSLCKSCHSSRTARGQ